MGAGLWPAVGRRLVGDDRHRVALEKRRIYALIPSTPPLVTGRNFNKFQKSPREGTGAGKSGWTVYINPGSASPRPWLLLLHSNFPRCILEMCMAQNEP